MPVTWLTGRGRARAAAPAVPCDVKPDGLSWQGQIFVHMVIAAGACVLLWSVRRIIADPPAYHWLLLAGLTFFSGPFSIRISSLGARVSSSEAFVFAVALLFGPAPAALTVAVDGLVVSLRLGKRGWSRMLFNVAEPALSVWVASFLFYRLSGVDPLFQQQVAVTQLLWPLVVLTTTYFVLNSGLIACAVAFETRTSPMRFLRTAAPHLSLNYFATLCLVVLVVQQSANLPFALAGVIVPLLVISYISSRTSIARVEDANRHLSELNQLYLSTVEALAVAIDAKDQITHGHIRRVQMQAVALARAVGVTDEREIKALEAAGLLHDVGKLAIPDYILNKPGRLTPVEFGQMQSHAIVGANILSKIHFPYPVGPIVRHHHERWDGGGYPDGLRGEDIPLGARILSVVDCFDALTSDRPYRRKLTDEDALAYLKTERNTRYDPHIVDTFVELWPTLPREPASDPAARREIAHMLSAGLPATAIVAAQTMWSPDEQLACELAEFQDGLEHDLFKAVGHAVSRALRNSGDTSLCVLYRLDPSTATLAAAYVSSEAYACIRRVRISLGERLSGWVAANRQTIVNSDPALDLHDLIDCREKLRSCMSTPLIWGDVLVGVVSLYSSAAVGFGDDHVHRVELLAPMIAECLSRRAGSPPATAASNRGAAVSTDLASLPAAERRHDLLVSYAFAAKS
jgi:putative nucleotidyltransferase with HDIG domain